MANEEIKPSKTNSFINYLGNIKIGDIVKFFVSNGTKILLVWGAVAGIAYATEDATAGKYFKYKLEQFKVLTADYRLPLPEDSSLLRNFLPKSLSNNFVLKAEMLGVEQSISKSIEAQQKLQSDVNTLNGSSIVTSIQLEQLLKENAELKESNKEINRDIKSILQGIARIQSQSN